jgi:hypothetical protein
MPPNHNGDRKEPDDNLKRNQRTISLTLVENGFIVTRRDTGQTFIANDLDEQAEDSPSAFDIVRKFFSEKKLMIQSLEGST